MNKKISAAVLFLFLSAGCATIDASKYEEVYFRKVKEKADEKIRETDSGPGSIKTGAVRGSEPGAEDKTAGEKGIKLEVGAKGAGEKAQGKTKAPEPGERKKRAKYLVKELTIDSDSMTYNKDTSVAMFRDNVRMVSEGVEIFADTLAAKNYRDSADARGNVRAYYKEYDMKLTCRRLVYGDNMKSITAYDNVIAKKILPDGNTLTMRSDEAEFDMEDGIITAYSVDRRVKVSMRDMSAFADKVIYNEDRGEVTLVGKPYVKKKKSLFFSEKVIIDVNSKAMILRENIWSKLYYSDFEEARKEAENFENKN